MHQKDSYLSRLYPWFYGITALALVVGFILSIVSWLEVCSSSCSGAQHYNFFGLSFGMIGIAFFSGLLIAHALAYRIPLMALATGLMIASGLGAELMLIIVQKYVIGQWCPICLGIAFTILVAAILITIKYLYELHLAVIKNKKTKVMRGIWKGITAITVFAMGFFLTFAGIGKEDKVMVAQSAVEKNLTFGNKKSPVTVYVFTDWQCPACRKAEPAIEKMFPLITKKAKVVFVDHAVHTESLNFIPYNLSFITKNKPNYLKLRHILTNISTETDAPTDEQVDNAIRKVGVHYQQLNYSDIVLGVRYFRRLVQQFNVQGTPTIIVYNTAKNAKRRLTGTNAITEKNVMEAIEALKQ